MLVAGWALLKPARNKHTQTAFTVCRPGRGSGNKGKKSPVDFSSRGGIFPQPIPAFAERGRKVTYGR